MTIRSRLADVQRIPQGRLSPQGRLTPQGRGGGKGGSGGSSGGTEAPNTLNSRSQAVVVDLLSEGPIQGLVNGGESIFVNNTPLVYFDVNNVGQFNYTGFGFALMAGTPDQSPLPGPPDVEETYPVGAQVKQAQPITRQIAQPSATGVRVTLMIPEMISVDSTGDLNPTSIRMLILIKAEGQSYYVAIDDTIDGKTTSQFEQDYYIPLPAGGYPWLVQMVRITADSDSTKLANDSYFAQYTEVVENRLIYPDSAIMGSIFDAQSFGGAVPGRLYEIYGRIISVPDNYDPPTRTYTGIWDGTFKQAWSDNPAWVYLDMLTHPRYGLGNLLSTDDVDVWTLYTIAQYCDQIIPDGYGGTEPRFTCNGQLMSQMSAYDMMQTLAACFRGMVYWGAGQVIATCDMPKTPVMTITNADVKDGMFQYVGTPLNGQHTIAYVSWNDPSNLYATTIEVVTDDAGIQMYGIRPVKIDASMCTSRGQARRMGKWMLDTEKNQGDTLTFTTGLNHLIGLAPGEIVNIADEFYEGLRFGGRIVAAEVYGELTQTIFTLDAPVALVGSPTAQWTLTCVGPDNVLQISPIDLVRTGQAPTTTVYTVNPMTYIQPNADWTIASSVVEPRPFMIVSIVENQGYAFDFNLVFNDPTKYDRVELDINNQSPNYSLFPSGAVLAPTNLNVQEYTYAVGSIIDTGLNISWTKSADPRANSYEVQLQGPTATAFTFYAYTSAPTQDVDNVVSGNWLCRVRTISPFGNSPWVTSSSYMVGAAGGEPDFVPNFALSVTNGTAYFTWSPVTQHNEVYYQIRYTVGSATTWESATIWQEDIRGTQTSGPAQDGVFYIKAIYVDNSGESTIAAEVSSFFSSVINTNIISTISENPNWSGTRVSTTVTNNELSLIPGQVYGAYQTAPLDLGGIYTSHISNSMLGFGQRADDTMSNWTELSAVPALASSDSDGWEIDVFIQTTNGNPNNAGSVWTALTPFRAGDYIARAMRFTINLYSTDGGITQPHVFQFTWVVDMPDRLDGANGVSVPAAGLRVTYAVPFHSPAIVGVTAIGLPQGTQVSLSNEDATGFNVVFLFPPETPPAAYNINWIAKGFGSQVG